MKVLWNCFNCQKMLLARKNWKTTKEIYSFFFLSMKRLKTISVTKPNSVDICASTITHRTIIIPSTDGAQILAEMFHVAHRFTLFSAFSLARLFYFWHTQKPNDNGKYSLKITFSLYLYLSLRVSSLLLLLYCIHFYYIQDITTALDRAMDLFLKKMCFFPSPFCCHLNWIENSISLSWRSLILPFTLFCYIFRFNSVRFSRWFLVSISIMFMDFYVFFIFFHSFAFVCNSHKRMIIPFVIMGHTYRFRLFIRMQNFLWIFDFCTPKWWNVYDDSNGCSVDRRFVLFFHFMNGISFFVRFFRCFSFGENTAYRTYCELVAKNHHSNLATL